MVFNLKFWTLLLQKQLQTLGSSLWPDLLANDQWRETPQKVTYYALTGFCPSLEPFQFITDGLVLCWQLTETCVTCPVFVSGRDSLLRVDCIDNGLILYPSIACS